MIAPPMPPPSPLCPVVVMVVAGRAGRPTVLVSSPAWWQCGVGHRSSHSLLLLLVTGDLLRGVPDPTWGLGLSIAQ